MASYEKQCGSGTWNYLGLSCFQQWYMCHFREIISASSLQNVSDTEWPSASQHPFYLCPGYPVRSWSPLNTAQWSCDLGLHSEPRLGQCAGPHLRGDEQNKEKGTGNPCQIHLTPRILAYCLLNPITSFPLPVLFSHLLLILALFWHPSENLTGGQSSQNFCGFLPSNPKSRLWEESQLLWIS